MSTTKSASTKKRTPSKPVVVRSFAPIEFETFREIGAWHVGQWEHKEPSCFNGIVSVEKYRVRVEKIDESKDVIRARLQKLWSESDNHHDHQPLKLAAERLGIILFHEEFGAWRRK